MHVPQEQCSLLSDTVFRQRGSRLAEAGDRPHPQVGHAAGWEPEAARFDGFFSGLPMGNAEYLADMVPE